MRQWTRATRDRLCGRCGEPIRKGAPIFEYVFRAVTNPKLRCAPCAGEPVPRDLPPLVERTPITAMTPIAHIRTGASVLPFDYKAAQVREPGEEG